MDFIDVLNKRFSVREFKEECPSDDIIDELLSVINKATSAKNIQPYHVRVLKSKESLISSSDSLDSLIMLMPIMAKRINAIQWSTDTI